MIIRNTLLGLFFDVDPISGLVIVVVELLIEILSWLVANTKSLWGGSLIVLAVEDDLVIRKAAEREFIIAIVPNNNGEKRSLFV